MDDEKPDGFDLWGNAVFSTKGKRGRPPFRWTEENASKVSMLLALGWSNERIAACIVDPRTGKAISVPTLKRYFRAEMSERERQRDRMEARRFERVWAQAEDGNVGAERLLSQLLERNDLMVHGRRLDRAQKKDDKPTPEKLGKKELAQRAAEQSVEAGDWGDLLKPEGWTN